MQLLILGAGGHAQVVADTALAMSRSGADIGVAGFLDDNQRLWGSIRLNAPVLGPLRSVPDCRFDVVIVGIGSNQVRMQVSSFWQQQGAKFATLIHPSAVIGTDVRIGAGSVLCAGVIVNTGSRIGDHVILNTACSVDHHNTIGDYVHLAPGVRLGGDVQVADEVLVGIGAVVMPQLQIGRRATIGAGAVVTRSVASEQTVVGVPARPVA